MSINLKKKGGAVKNEQYRDIGNIGTIHRKKTKKNTMQNTKKKSNTNLTGDEPRHSRRISCSWFLIRHLCLKAVYWGVLKIEKWGEGPYIHVLQIFIIITILWCIYFKVLEELDCVGKIVFRKPKKASLFSTPADTQNGKTMILIL